MNNDNKIILIILSVITFVEIIILIQSLLLKLSFETTLWLICIHSFVFLTIYISQYEAKTFNIFTGDYDYHYSIKTRKQFMLIHIISLILIAINSLLMLTVVSHNPEARATIVGNAIFTVIIFIILCKKGYDFKKLSQNKKGETTLTFFTSQISSSLL